MSNKNTFGEVIPQDVWDTITSFGINIYSAGGSDGVLRLGGNWPHKRNNLTPLTLEESEKMLKAMRKKLLALGYTKMKLRMFEHKGNVDPNDFRFRILVIE